MENLRKDRDDALKRETEAKNQEHQRWKELEFERQRNKTLSQNTDNIIYTRFYNYGLDLIPTYYSYLERRNVEEMLTNLLKRSLDKLNEEQMEQAIKKLIKDSNPDTTILVQTPPATKPKRKTPKRKSPKKKPSKKAKSKKMSKRSKRTTKKK